MDYNIYECGAKGDGMTLDTHVIQHAIDTCSERGGGRIVFPKGVFLTGTLYMKSHVEIHLTVNATLMGSSNIADYTRDTHKQLYRNESHMDRCLIFSYMTENISLTGQGTIYGQGEKFKEKLENVQFSRPMMIRFLDCKNIHINGLKLLNPAAWTSAFIRCENIWADSVDILSRANANGDGFDFDCCQNVFVSNCKLDCSDDCICLQNSETERACKNILVTNTLMCSKWAGMRIGLLSCGPIENVTVSNCIFRDIECSGLKIQSAEGSVLQDMVFNNLVMENVQRPLFITLNHYRERVDMADEVPQTSRLRNMFFSNICASGRLKSEKWKRSCIIIDGLPGYYIEDITLSGISYTAVGGVNENMLEDDDIPHHDQKRAECFNYKGSLPAYGLFARHVKNLKLNNLEIRTMKPDQREKIYCEDCI